MSSSPDRPADRGGAHLTALLREYLAARKCAGASGFAAFLRERNPHVFSHHDCTRDDYLDHVWRCGGFLICRGCTAVLLATVVGFAAALATGWPGTLPDAGIAAIFTGLLLIALIPLPESPRTWLHDLRRLALGLLLGSAAAYLILVDEWLPRVVVIAVYVSVLVVRRIARKTR